MFCPRNRGLARQVLLLRILQGGRLLERIGLRHLVGTDPALCGRVSVASSLESLQETLSSSLAVNFNTSPPPKVFEPEARNGLASTVWNRCRIPLKEESCAAFGTALQLH